MREDDADLVLALEGNALVGGVFELAKPPPDWPRIIVVMRDDTAHALGIITGLIVRAVPHRDRSYVGVAAEQRLRELWIPMGESLQLTQGERSAAEVRAEQRHRSELAKPRVAPDEPLDPRRIGVAEPPGRRPPPQPLSITVLAPFRPGIVWSLSDHRVVAIEVVPDPFRSPAPPPSILVVTGDDDLYARLAASAPKHITLVRAPNVRTAMESLELRTPRRIVCGESLALGDGGLLERVEIEHPELLAAFDIVCAEASADWLTTYLATRTRTRIRLMEEPLIEEDFEDLMERAR